MVLLAILSQTNLGSYFSFTHILRHSIVQSFLAFFLQGHVGEIVATASLLGLDCKASEGATTGDAK